METNVCTKAQNLILVKIRLGTAYTVHVHHECSNIEGISCMYTCTLYMQIVSCTDVLFQEFCCIFVDNRK